MSTSINRDLRIFSLREVEKIHDAAFLAGRIKQAEEISEMAEILAEARAIGEFATSIRAVADRLRAEGEGEPK